MTNLAVILAKLNKQNANPASYGECVLAKVINLEPLTLSLANEQIQVCEADATLIIPEWFQFRCDIDKAGALSSDVPSMTDNAQSINETHSYGGAPCSMPDAVKSLSSAILSINNELLKLKCILNIGDKCILSPLGADSQYVLIDKVKG